MSEFGCGNGLGGPYDAPVFQSAVEQPMPAGDEDRSDESRVDHDSDDESKSELAERRERTEKERRETARRDRRGRTDQTPRARDRLARSSLKPQKLGLLLQPGHQKDIVIDPHRDQQNK